MNRWVQRALGLALLLGVVLTAFSYYQGKNPQPEKTQSEMIFEQIQKTGVQDFQLHNLDGKFVQLSQFKGKLILLSFWASWCGPCVEEFPSQLELIKQFGDRVVFVAVSVDEKSEDIKSFLKAFDVSNPQVVILRDPSAELARKWGTFKLPESFLIDKNFSLVDKATGSENWLRKHRIDQFEKLAR